MKSQSVVNHGGHTES